jgi:di/tricarboxylate transporter
MSFEAYVTLGVVLISFVLFAKEYFSIDHIALCIIAVLVITGVLTAEEGVKGFANPATITVASMFVLSDALLRTGLLERLGPFFIKLLQKSYRGALLTMISTTGFISGFINNTPVVASLIPIINTASKKTSIPASKLLIPLSFGAMFGGCITLIGTSTNLLINGIAVKAGLDPIGMFDFAPLGLIFFAVGTVYLLFMSNILLPSTSGQLDDADIQVKNYLTEITILPKPEGKTEEVLLLSNLFRQDGMEVEVLRIRRDKRTYEQPEQTFALEEDDHLIIRGEREKIRALLKNEALYISENMGSRTFENEETRLVEIVVLPTSDLVNKRLDDIDFLSRFRAKILAIRQRGTERLGELGRIRLKAGDMLYLQTSELGFKLLRRAEQQVPAPFVSLGSSEAPSVNKWKLSAVVLIIGIIVTLAAMNILPIMVGALAGIAALVFLGITRMEDAYQAIDWKVVILLGGALCLGEAMSKSGLSEMMANMLVVHVGKQMGAVAVVSVLYLTTSILTEIMSNNAAAALLAPIALSIAASFGVDPLPFLMAIAFAASASFMTPIGYQTNTMVYSAGNYAFKDFTKIGAPLNIIFWIVATVLIPLFYPL